LPVQHPTATARRPRSRASGPLRGDAEQPRRREVELEPWSEDCGALGDEEDREGEGTEGDQLLGENAPAGHGLAHPGPEGPLLVLTGDGRCTEADRHQQGEERSEVRVEVALIHPSGEVNEPVATNSALSFWLPCVSSSSA